MGFQTSSSPIHTMTDYSLDGKFITLDKKRGNSATGVRHSESEKAHAAALYAVTRNMVEVSKITNINEKTLSRWKQEPWFGEIVDRVKKEHNEVLDAKFSKVLDKAAEEMQDRVENGDFVLTKDGATVRVPVRARDLATVAGTLFDRRQLLRGEATSLSASVNPEEKLKQLWDKFEKFNQAREVTQEDTNARLEQPSE
jgi:transposase-like protein